MILATEQNKQRKSKPRIHHTTKRKNKQNLASPTHSKRGIYEKAFLAGAKFRIFSTPRNLQTPKFIFNTLGKHLVNLLETSPLIQLARILPLSAKMAVSWEGRFF